MPAGLPCGTIFLLAIATEDRPGVKLWGGGSAIDLLMDSRLFN